MTDNNRSSVITQVIAGLIIAATLGAISFILSTFKLFIVVAKDFLNHLQETSEWPNWCLYLLVLMSIYNLVYWLARFINLIRPNVETYNHDTFLNLQWRWSYISGYPANVQAFCPHCETMLVYSEVGGHFDIHRETILTCETCNRDLLSLDGDKDSLVLKIHRQIDRKIRTGEWQNVVEKYPK
jgi:ribosomal protein S27E